MPGRCGGGPEIDPSTVATPAAASVSASSATAAGAIALRSANSLPAAAGWARDLERHLPRGARRHDRQHDVATAEQGRERADVLEPRPGRSATRPLRPAVERDDHAHATVDEPRAERAPHLARTDQPDGHRPERTE